MLRGGLESDSLGSIHALPALLAFEHDLYRKTGSHFSGSCSKQDAASTGPPLSKALNIIEKQSIEQGPRLAYIQLNSSHSWMTTGFAFLQGRAKRRGEFAMTTAPLMPKATAVWLVENTALSFDQIAQF